MNQLINKLFFLFVAFSFASLASAQEVTVIGKAEAYKGNEVRLYIYDDFITSRELLIGTGAISEKGDFKIKASLGKTMLAFIKIENTAAHIYLEPNSTYHVIVPPLDNTKSPSPENVNFVALQFEQQEAKELNALIMDFNNLYDNFLEDNYNLILKKAQLPIASFKNKTDSLYATADSPFFKDFRSYSIASLEQMAYKNKVQLYQDYLAGKPVQYNNPEYMNFFKQFYKSYLLLFSQSQRNEKALVEDINVRKDYNAVMNTLKRDSSVTNDTIRELLLINGLYEVYHNEKFAQKSIDVILKAISKNSPVLEHRTLAANIILQTSRLAAGNNAPGFELYDSTNKLVKLEDFKGKYVYLDFWATWCKPCLQEMKVMTKLHQKYGDKIVFVNISIDKKESTQNDFLKTNNYPWTFLHYSNFKQVKEDYKVSSIPAYFLIGPDGKFLQAPAERPTGNIEKTFHEITTVPEKKFKVGEK